MKKNYFYLLINKKEIKHIFALLEKFIIIFKF